MKLKYFLNLRSDARKTFKGNFLVFLILASLLAISISLLIGMAQSVWFDEAYSILVAKQPIDQLIHLAAVDTHPPLYYILLKCWASVFGWGELALRSFSVVFMGAAVFFAGLLIKKLFSERAALITLPLLVFAPFLLRYGFEIRMYAFASFIGVAATYVLVNAIEQKNKNQQIKYFGLYAILVAVGMYSLYYTAFIWLTHFVWLAWRSIQKRESLIRSPWLISYLGSVVLFLPWLPAFAKQFSGGALAAIMQPMTVDNLLGTISFSFLYKPIWQLDAFMSLLFMTIFGVIVYFAVKAFQVVDKSKRQVLTLIALYWLMPIAILALIGLFRPMYVERYMAHFIIGESIFLGVAISMVAKKRIHAILYSLLVVGSLIGAINLSEVGNFNYQRMQYPNIKLAAKLVSCLNDDTILVDNPYEAVEFSYYLPDCQIYFQSESDDMGGGYAPVSNKGFSINNPSEYFTNSKRVIHIYYKNTDIEMPATLISTTTEKAGDFFVETFTSR